MVRTLSETVVIPIAGMILTFVLCYELIQLIIEKNNLSDFDTFNIFKWIFKTFIAVFILTNTFNIVMGVFDVAQHVINESAGLISGSLDLGSDAMMDAIRASLEAMGVGELLGLFFEVQIVRLCMLIMSIVIMIIVWGRMLEIYLVVSVAPIPFSTMVNRDEVCCKRVITTSPQITGSQPIRSGLHGARGRGYSIIVAVTPPIIPTQKQNREAAFSRKEVPSLPRATPEGGAR